MLYGLLPGLYDDLSVRLSATAIPLHSLRDRLASVPDTPIGAPVPRTVEIHNPEEGQVEVSIRALRADTYRQVEEAKWQAIYDVSGEGGSQCTLG